MTPRMQPFDADGLPVDPETRALIERVARVAHEANRAWCAAHGDGSQSPWAEAPEWQRRSARSGVLFHLRYPNADASASHDAWSAEKRLDGWVWGPVKDPALKQHPCLVPFDQLPPEQQAKDRLFRAVVHSLLLEPTAAEKAVLERWQGWLAEVRYKDWRFHVAAVNSSFYLQVRFEAPMNGDGAVVPWSGRKWRLSPHMTRSEVVQTALKAVLTAEEHEAREAFRFRGKAIFGPHYDVEALAILCGRHSALDVRDEGPQVGAA